MRRSLLWLGLVALVLVLAWALAACQAPTPEVIEKEVVVTQEVPVEVTRIVEKEVPVEVTRVVEVVKEVTPEPTPIAFHENSLHATSGGMAYWYSAENGGFESFTNVPYEELGCKNCHAKECSDCHVSQTYAPPPQSKCLKCHGRQKAGLAKEDFVDVHSEAGLQCINCHTMDQVHGDGNAYNSLLVSPSTKCTDCHAELSDTTAHSVHSEDLDCTACHAKQAVTCYNCHFDTEVKEHKKVANQRFFDTRLLVKKDGKVHLGTFMSLVYQDTHSFVALAPFFGHSVIKPDPETICAECHNNPFVKEYNESGTMTVTYWDEAEGKVQHNSGVVPVPADYAEALKFSFVTKDAEGNWVFMEDGADAMQMLFAEPLDKLPPQFGD